MAVLLVELLLKLLRDVVVLLRVEVLSRMLLVVVLLREEFWNVLRELLFIAPRVPSVLKPLREP